MTKRFQITTICEESNPVSLTCFQTDYADLRREVSGLSEDISEAQMDEMMAWAQQSSPGTYFEVEEDFTLLEEDPPSGGIIGVVYCISN